MLDLAPDAPWPQIGATKYGQFIGLRELCQQIARKMDRGAGEEEKVINKFKKI
jgi:hypothetical protein